MIPLHLLPGGNLIDKGLGDIAAGQLSPEACLIAIARGRLSRAGLSIPPGPDITDPELQLYAILQNEPGDAYSRYNSLIRQLISFSQALEAEKHRASPSGSNSV